jgi:hypothetical protein
MRIKGRHTVKVYNAREKDIPDYDVEHNDGENDTSLDPVLDDKRHDGDDDKDGRQAVGHLPQ